MYWVIRKHLNQKPQRFYEFYVPTGKDPVEVFSNEIRQLLADDDSGKYEYRLSPKPGWYDWNDNEVLLDGDITRSIELGDNTLFFEKGGTK